MREVAVTPEVAGSSPVGPAISRAKRIEFGRLTAFLEPPIASISSMSPEFEYYAISRGLGEGGMGLVYPAHARRPGLPVAIKVMSRREFDPELQARFLKEYRILSALNPRNIVRCYEITESRDGVLS